MKHLGNVDKKTGLTIMSPLCTAKVADGVQDITMDLGAVGCEMCLLVLLFMTTQQMNGVANQLMAVKSGKVAP